MRTIALACAIVISGCDCGSSGGGTDDAGTRRDGAMGGDGSVRPDGAPPPDGSTTDDGGLLGPPVGTIEPFADVGGPSDSIVLAGDSLLVSMPAANAVVRVDASGAVTPFATVPGALGMAVETDGSVLVAGLTAAGGDGAVWRVGSDGSGAAVITTMDPMGGNLVEPDSVAIVPGGGFVFDDAERYTVLRADDDGTNVRMVSGAVAAPAGLAFWRDATELLIPSWTADVVFVLPYDRAMDTFGRVRPQADAEGVEGVALAAGGDAILVSTDIGVLRLPAAGGPPTSIHGSGGLGSPAGGAFGAGPLGPGWLYLTDRGGPMLNRIWIGEAGAPLPAP